MSISDKLIELNNTKQNIRTAISNKGVDMNNVPFTKYHEKINEIGGQSATGDYRVRFWDYNGTYKDVYVNEGEDATPPNFDHSVATDFAPALTFQGWNKPITNITRDTEVGAVYIPTDGKTHFYLQITGGTGKDITLYSANNGNCNIVINWGDGTADFSSTATEITASHTFADYGVYHCTIENTLTGDFWLGLGSTSTSFCGGNSQQMRDALMAIYLGEKFMFGATSHSFYCNYALKHVTIPNSVTSIGDYAFQQCYSLTNITIPSGVTSIGTYAFQNCYSITNSIISNSVTSIGTYAFQNCYSLTNMTIPSDVNSIKINTFQNCYSLTNITIPSGVINIGNSAFQQCYSLTNITIPSGVISIGNSAFRVCSSLTNITIPSGVTSIGSYAFYNCFSLKKVLIKGDTVKTLDNNNAFLNIPASTIFFVKDELVESYKVAANWSTYADQIMPISQEGNYYG